jgi:hypothetical protein
MTSIATLVQDLTANSSARLESLPTGELMVTGWRGEILAPPVRLNVSDESLARYLAAVGEGAAPVFPDVDRRTAAYRLLLVHLDEAFIGGIPTEIIVDAQGVRRTGVQPRSEVEILDPQGLRDGDLEWVAGHPDPPPE